jgi:hypothetical protein
MWCASRAATKPRAEIDELVHDPKGTAALGRGKHAYRLRPVDGSISNRVSPPDVKSRSNGA